MGLITRLFTSVFDKHGYSGVPCIDLYIPVISR